MVLLIVGMILIDRIFSIQASATFSVEYGLQADLMVVLEIEDETRVETFEVDNMVINIYSIEVETFEVTICSRYGHGIHIFWPANLRGKQLGVGNYYYYY